MPGDSHRPSHDEIELFSLALDRLDEALDVADRDRPILWYAMD